MCFNGYRCILEVFQGYLRITLISYKINIYKYSALIAQRYP